MNYKTLLAALVVSLFCISVSINSYAQTNYKQASFQQTADICFTKTLIFLQQSNYFIEATDKAAGYIKAKSFSKKVEFFSAKVGERTSVSFLFVPDGNTTQLHLNIYAEDLNWGGSTQNRVISVQDKGIVDNPAPYKKLIDELTAQLQ